MLYIGINYEGKEVYGHVLKVDLTGTWIREETPYGYTETRVEPDNVREIEEE